MVVAIYAAVLAFVYVVISVRTLRLRRNLQIAIGDAGNPQMLRAMRVHSNFAEYVPLALLLIAFVEIGGSPAWLVHLLGLMLLSGRAVHAWGVSQVREDFRLRVFGMAMTLATLLISAAFLLGAALFGSGG